VYKLKKNLVLTGMMGSGKSTIGKHLSEQLKMHYADIDDIIEKKLSISISEIFEKKGEDFFRKIETEESIKIIEKSNYIIALGGGAFMNNKIREVIKKNSVSVWLDLDINLIYKRTNDIKKRPLLKNMSLEDLNSLNKKREPIYSLADIKINCNSKNKNEIVNEIIKIYENR
tara:strand:+ start:2664 stop:3179 length:516 start_codon:yes stop_codon:yes gene_type:complete